jgi:hypothetical protein
MKKLAQSLSDFDLPSVTLYLDDIATIIALFAELSANIGIETQDTAFESLEELAQYGQNHKSLHNLTIKSVEPYMTLEFRRSSAHFYASDSTLEMQGMFAALKNLLKHNRKATWFMNSIYGGLLLGALVSFCLYFGISILAVGRVLGQPLIMVLSISPLLFAGILAWRVFYTQMREYSTIVLKNRSDLTNFWVRKQDDIVLVVITALVTAIATAIVTYLLK